MPSESNVMYPASVLVGIMMFSLSIHKVEEGYVAVYFRGGVLLSQICDPGFHLLVPFITSYNDIQVTLQTDAITNVPCGTSGGAVIIFGKIEVVNILRKHSVYSVVKNYTIDYDKPLIYDKIHHELNQFCSRHTLREVYIDLFDQIDEYLKSVLQSELDIIAPGLEIFAVRVTKPVVPDNIKRSYEELEAVRANMLLAAENHRLVQKEMETEKMKAIMKASQTVEVNNIEMKRQLTIKHFEQRISEINDAIYKSRQMTKAEVNYRTKVKQAKGNGLLFTPKYLQVKKYEAIANFEKLYVGSNVLSAFSNFTAIN